MMLFCAAGAALADTSAPATSAETLLPTEWKSWNNHHYRLEADGHLSCYSENSSKTACSINAPDPAKAQPLRCNDPRWGGKSRQRTGYEVVDHWCNKAYAALFATWMDHTATGHPQVLSTTPNGDTMCLSFDGTACLPAKYFVPANVRRSRGSWLPSPLFCGRTMRRNVGFTGYEAEHAGHWCQTPWQVLFSERLPDAEEDQFGCTFRAKVPGWLQSEEVGWILRMRAAPRASQVRSPSYLTFKVQGSDWSASTVVTATGGVGVLGQTSSVEKTSPRWIDVSDGGELSIGILLRGNDRVRYYGAAGWPDNLFDDTHALVSDDDAARDASLVLARGSNTPQGEITVDYTPQSGRSCSDHEIHTVAMVRRRASVPKPPAAPGKSARQIQQPVTASSPRSSS